MQYREIKYEDDVFIDCIDEAKLNNKLECQNIIEKSMEIKKKIFNKYLSEEISDIEAFQNKCNTMSDKLWQNLMTLEINLVDQFEETINAYETNRADMIENFIEEFSANIAQMQDLENNFNEKLSEVAIVTLEKVVKNEIDDEILKDIKDLFLDKDTLINSIASSHEKHVSIIEAIEENINSRIRSDHISIIENINNIQDIERNRKRVVEISQLIDNLRDECDQYVEIEFDAN
ncbi:hypothetical protein A3Q56_06246 [Intoshia linei]|uniref:Uncharacterized protein n=1 Tax=Intoshia linei TaxID=1819745 RepID=A0A177AXD7_9BILA|nr:hypothetical protein A3Q56_06246 [Intoshia linei]